MVIWTRVNTFLFVKHSFAYGLWPLDHCKFGNNALIPKSKVKFLPVFRPKNSLVNQCSLCADQIFQAMVSSFRRAFGTLYGRSLKICWLIQSFNEHTRVKSFTMSVFWLENDNCFAKPWLFLLFRFFVLFFFCLPTIEVKDAELARTNLLATISFELSRDWGVC